MEIRDFKTAQQNIDQHHWPAFANIATPTREIQADSQNKPVQFRKVLKHMLVNGRSVKNIGVL